MKPDWDKLMGDFEDSKTALVADVDCTADGKPLCESNGVRGYPTIKYGDPASLEDYNGGRDYDTLKSFADKNLKPICGPMNIDLCEDDKKAEIEKFMAMEEKELNKLIAAEEKKLEKAEKDFKDEVAKLQTKYQELTKAKEEKLAAVKEAGLGLMKSCLAAAKKKAEEKDEL